TLRKLAAWPPGPVGYKLADRRIRLAAARLGVLARFQHQERRARAGHAAAAFRARASPDRRPWRAVEIAAELVAQKHVRMLRLERAADQQMRRLAGADAGRR